MPRRATSPAAEPTDANLLDASLCNKGSRLRARDHAPTVVELRRCRAEIGRLLPLWPCELADMTPAGGTRIVAILERALRAERRRGLAGHWTYNLARHAQLLRAYQIEKAAARHHEHAARRQLAREAPERPARP